VDNYPKIFFFETKAKALPYSLIKKKNAQLINGKPGENHTTRQTPHGAAKWHSILGGMIIILY
jgi:hypothetical protein